MIESRLLYGIELVHTARVQRSQSEGTESKTWLNAQLLSRGSKIDDPEAVCYNANSSKFQTVNAKKEKRGKTLNWEKESKEIREGLDIS